MGLFGLNTYVLSKISHNLILNPGSSVTLENHNICLGIQSPTVECNNQLEVSICVALTWYLLIPIIMKIFMTIVIIFPKSPRFVVSFSCGSVFHHYAASTP